MAEKPKDDKVVERHVQSGEVTWDKERKRDIRRATPTEAEDPPQRAVAEVEREDAQRDRKSDDEAHGDAGLDR